ncbi:MAG: ABC transporter permease [Holophagae bacterium]|jgi:phospholipid/cholesterol/gamma-HCH transport system permease protein
MIGLLGRLGRWALEQLGAALNVSVLMVETFSWVVVAPLTGRGFRTRSSVEHFVEYGARSLPIVGMICFLIGVIIALQASYTLDRFGANRYIADLVAVSALRELAPLMTAILIAGRCGSAITAEIGTMKVNEEIDALEVMGVSPLKYLVAPKFTAMVLAVPAVTALAMGIMICGGWLSAVLVVGVESEVYISQTVGAIVEKDLLTGLVKSLFFGIAICWVGVYRGFQVEGGAEGVGRRTTSSVVTSIFLIIFVDLIFTVLFYYL